MTRRPATFTEANAWVHRSPKWISRHFPYIVGRAMKMSRKHYGLLMTLGFFVGIVTTGCTTSGCVPWPRMSSVHLEGRKIDPGAWKDVPFPGYEESAKEYRARLPRLKSRDEIAAFLAKTRFPTIEETCRFGDEAERWRDTCPRPDHFGGVKGAYPKPEGMAHAWIVCDSARELALVPARDQK